jgi:hypothetical protein
MSSPPSDVAKRPREVTLGALQAIIGSAVVLVLVLSVAERLDSGVVQEALTQLQQERQFRSLNITVEELQDLMRYALMVLGVVSVTSLILGIYVLRRHRASRIVLTGLGAGVAVTGLLAGPPGWVITGYVAVSVYLLWTKSARAWFAPR